MTNIKAFFKLTVPGHEEIEIPFEDAEVLYGQLKDIFGAKYTFPMDKPIPRPFGPEDYKVTC